MIAERATVVGAGSWGTAFSLVLADAGLDVRLWARRPELADSINRTGRNPDSLPDVDLPPQVTATSSVVEALEDTDLVVLAMPAQKLRDGLVDWAPHLPDHAPLVSLAKGIELRTGCRMSEVIRQATGAAPERVAVVSGPNLAREIAARQPAAGVVAASDAETADLVATACQSPWFRPYTSTDVVGAEIAGATKNVIALAVGAAEGLGLGDNSKASVITRGLAETGRLGVALGADEATFSGLAGVGDLIATCMSPLSRNHRVGVGLGRGGTVTDVVAAIGQTAEGVTSCESVLALARGAGVDVPIVESVVAMVADGQRPELIVDALMSRQRKPETA